MSAGTNAVTLTPPRRRAPLETWLFGIVGGVAMLVFGAAAVGAGIQAPPLAAQIVVLAVLGAVLGLPHGALDPLIAQRLGLWRGPVGFAVFNLAYIGAVAAVVGLWLLAPVASLAVFLLVSAAHFGDDWNADRPRWLRLTAGIALLSLPSLGHHDEVAGLYETLAPGATVLADSQRVVAVVALVGMLLGAVAAWQRRRSESVELVLAASLALLAPPLVFFVIYFCTLHSARHLREGFAAERRGRTTVLITVLYTVVPILGAVGLLLATTQAPVTTDARLLQIVFIGLAGLTVPHMALVALESQRTRRAAAVSAPPA